jgi:Histidine kinase-, DNA gyrase B-, and HSP90-like ATPase
VAPHVRLDLSEVVTEAAGELEPVAGDHMISVDAEPGAELEGARDELHRLTLNLLENALRHTDPGTAVEATVERRNGEVVLSVEDDGPGIPPELRDKVFERFFRGAGDRSGSSGLGLSIVRAVADAHGARLELEPRAGGGLVAAVRFPSEPLFGGRRGSGRAVAPERHGDRVRLDRPLLSRVRGALQVGVDPQQAVDRDPDHRDPRAQRADEDRSH